MKGIIPMPVSNTQRDEVRQRFLRESTAYRVSSPLFSSLARASSEDDDMIELVAATRPGQSKGLLIFYVVQFLLMKSPETPLAQYFPSLTEHPKPAVEAFDTFREFCLEHRDEITELLSWRTVNTNLVEKAICLVPAFRYIQQLAGGAPLTLLELCCSAGINMLFDQYHYDYGVAGSVGPSDSPVQLECKIIGSGRPPVDVMPHIAQRVGVDLVKVNTSDPLEQLWMQAVLCPEWNAERRRLKAALSIRTQHELRIIQGDALGVVGPLLDELSGQLCILMSYCIGHWSNESVIALDELLRRASLHRDIHRLDVELKDVESPQTARTRLIRLSEAGLPVLRKRSPSRMDHTWYSGGQAQSRQLGEGDAFGEWLDWHVTETGLRASGGARGY
jgi:hypothetical protein